MYERLAVCMWASVSMRRAALCAASVSSWGGTVRNTRVLHVGCRLANTVGPGAQSPHPAQKVKEVSSRGSRKSSRRKVEAESSAAVEAEMQRARREGPQPVARELLRPPPTP